MENPLAPEHWTIEKTKRSRDQELQKFREKQKSKLRNLREEFRVKVEKLYDKLYCKIRWSNPDLPSPFQFLLFNYADFLIDDPTREDSNFPQDLLLKAWFQRLKGTDASKTCDELQILLTNIRKSIVRRDETLSQNKSILVKTTEKMIMKKTGELKWKMETNKGVRDSYWTIWYLASNQLLSELERYIKQCDDIKAHINEPDKDLGLTALHYACKHGHLNVIRMLIKYGADENARSSDGRTPLHFAASYGTKELVQEILASGADYYAKDIQGRIALDFAIINKNTPVVDMLQNWFFNIEEDKPPEAIVYDGSPIDGIPEEFLSTPTQTQTRMSLTLQVLTVRLQGQGPHSFQTNSNINIISEIRLCERHAALCLSEGFRGEALRTSYRRWYLVRREIGLKLGSDSSDSIIEDEGIQQHLMQSIQGKKELQLQVAVSGGMPEESDNRTAGQSFAEEIRTSPAPASELGTSVIDTSSTVPNAVTSATAVDMIPVTLPTSTATATTSTTTATTSTSITATKPIVSNTFVLTVGSDLAETLITMQLEGLAHEVLVQCLHIPDIVGYIRVNLLYRLTQVSLFIHDEIKYSDSINLDSIRLKPFREKNFFQYFDKQVWVNNSWNKNISSTSTSTMIGTIRCTNILNYCDKYMKEAREIVSQLHSKDMTEPITLSYLLVLHSDIFERQGLILQAMEIRLYATTVCERILGYNNPLTLSNMLETIRLRILCSTPEAYKEIEIYATDICRRLDTLKYNNQDIVEKLGRRCAEFVALAKLLESGSMILPTDSMSLNGSEVSEFSGRSSVAGGSTVSILSTPRNREVSGLRILLNDLKL